MRDLFYTELKDICNGLVLTKEQVNELVESALIMERFAKLAKKEGLLFLEEVVVNAEEESFDSYLKELINLIVDGYECEDVERIGFATYCTSEFSAFEKLKYLLYLQGTLQIQAFVPPVVFEKYIASMFPVKVRREYIRRKKVEADKAACEDDILAKRIEKMCNPVKYPDEDNPIYKSFLALDDKGMQRLLREVECSTLSLALKRMPGNVRKIFLSNISRRLVALIIEDMDRMGPVKREETNEAIEKIFDILQILEERGEIQNQ